jgi:peptidoglycan/LPS O-acetylase OafA/YrhL
MREQTGISAERFAWVEIFRGLAILEVILHHVTGRFLRLLPEGSVAWLTVAVVNRTFHYAVPAFLMLSALILALSLLRRYELGAYLRNRLLRALWPYLLWSGLYLGYRWWAYDVPPSLARLDDYLLWGKAYFHLYFLAVALQLYLVLPLVVPWVRRSPPFWLVLLTMVGVTLGAYVFNRWVYRMPYVGSWLLWYTPTVLLGLWLASQQHRLPQIVRRGMIWSLFGACVGLAVYLPLALAVLRGNPVNTFLYQVANWLYTGCVSFVLLSVAWWLSQQAWRWVEGVRLLGRYSLQIYLLHPLVISELSRWEAFPEPLGARFALPIYLMTALLLPLVAALLLSRLRLSVLVFGRT